MERALVRGAVAEEAGRYFATPTDLSRQSRAGGDRQAGADDAVGTQDADAEVGDVHRPAFAFAVAGLLAENLSHHRLKLAALGDQVSVTAVRAGDVVSVGERCAHTCRRGFLTNRHMHEAGHFALFEQVAQTFLKLADRLHGTVHLEQCVLAHILGTYQNEVGQMIVPTAGTADIDPDESDFHPLIFTERLPFLSCRVHRGDPMSEIC